MLTQSVRVRGNSDSKSKKKINKRNIVKFVRN